MLPSAINQLAVHDSMPSDSRSHHLFAYGWATLLSLLAVIYLTLLPFEFREVSLADAWRQYLAMDQGGVKSSARQQWMANALMFLPLGFFLTAWLTVRVRSIAARVLLGFLVCLFCLAVTAAVEFGQVWLPYRNPSLNDISANFAGGVIGVVIRLVAGSRLASLADLMRREGLPVVARHVLALYALCYVVVSLLPFDFLLSLHELRVRWASEHWSWWRSADHCGDTLIRCGMLDLVKVLLAVPLGLWLHRSLDGGRVGLALLAAIVIGFAVEAAQFLLVSGRAEGYSGLLRAAGAAGGVLLAPALWRLDIRRLRDRWGRVLALALAGPYALLVIALALGNREYHWDVSLAWEQLCSLRLLPFYYHYFVPEAVAIRSVLLTVLLYAPVGGLLWLGVRDGMEKSPSPLPLSREGRGFFVVGALVALAVEAAKLFAEGLRPDPTNVWIAGVAAWGCWYLLDRLTGSVRESEVADRLTARPRRSMAGLLVGVVLAGCVVFAATRHPIAPSLAVAAVLVYGALILRWPGLWLVLVPAALPVLDFTPWTGRLYFDEWDLLVVATLAALWLRGFISPSPLPLRGPPSPASRGVRGTGRFWLVVFLLSYAAAVLIALWPPSWPGTLEFASLHSPYNALRLAKGVLWALLLWPFFATVVLDWQAAFNRFALGMVLGLAATVAIVCWERFLFTGLFDFSTAYRVAGMFSGNHTGGAFLEAYLVTAVPFLAMVLVWRRWWWPVAVLLFLLAAYAVAVTFARAGYAGLLVALLVILVTTLWCFGTGLKSRLAAVVALLLVGGGGLAVLDRVQQGEFMSQRVEIQQIMNDLETRLDHWRQSLEPVLADTRATWTGLGVGRFPEVHFWESVVQGWPVPAIYTLSERAGEMVLTLMPGRSLYFWQAVTVAPETEYRVEVIGRAGEERARLGVRLCEKWILYTRRCVSDALDFETGDGLQTRVATLRSPAQLTGYRFDERPSKLILYNASRLDYLELVSVSLLDPAGRELLVNGDFAQGMDRWFFTSDDHLAWHVKNLWVQMFFEQGLIGLVSWTLLVLVAFWSAVRKMNAGGPEAWPAAVLLAALSGFLTVGLFDSLFDVPRLATLFFFLVLLALTGKSSPSDSRRA